MFSRFAHWSKATRDGSPEQLRLLDLEGQIRAIDRSFAVIEFALDGTILQANDNFLRATGYALPEVQGQHHRMFVDSLDSNSTEYRQFWDHLGRGEYHSGQYRRIAKGGRELWLQASYNPILDTQGRPVNVVKYCTDITEQKRRAADHEGQIAAIDKSQAVIEFELDGTIRRANENFLRTVGYAAHELQGKHHRMFVDSQTADSPDYAAFWDRLGQGRFDAGVYRRVAKGGREIWLQATYNPIVDASGRPFKVVKYASDITEHKKLTDRLAAMVDNIKTSAAEIQVSAEEISKGNTSLSGRVESQAAGLEQTSASMARMTETVRANAERARQASEFAVTARERAEQGGKVMEEAVAAMQAIETSSQQIADIIGVIDGIAFQTNLLALNAAVEAARANEHGRGFAVVASEVRSLAGRSADAAKQIKALIGASVQKISVGVQLVGQSGSHLSDIVSSVKNVSEVVRDISGYCTEQADGINEVGRAVAQMEESTQQNAAMVEEAAAASESIVDQVRELNAAVCDDMSSSPHQEESQVRKPAVAQTSAVSRIRPVERMPLARSALTKMRQRV